jgi:small subunit ribosomal protein S6
MPIELYETMFLLDSAKLAAEPDAVKGQLATTLEKHGGKIEVARPWDDRKLAYPIKKQKKGSYYVVYYRMESRNQQELDRDFKLNENILRYLTSHIDPKWAEAMMDSARNDTAPAFAIRGLQDEVSATDINPNLGEGVPEGEAVAAATAARRPRREPAEKSE